MLGRYTTGACCLSNEERPYRSALRGNKIAVPVNRNRELWPNIWLGY